MNESYYFERKSGKERSFVHQKTFLFLASQMDHSPHIYVMYQGCIQFPSQLAEGQVTEAFVY